MANPIPASVENQLFERLVAGRYDEQQWLFLNGFNNGDPQTNGEFRLLALCAPRSALLLDIGYNEGLVSAEFRRLNPAVRVLGFEPNPAMPSQPTPDQLVRIALSDTTDPAARFLIHRKNSGVSSLNERTQMNPSFRKDFDSFEVRVERLDALYAELAPTPCPTFMKIDVEGSDARVIRGAQRFFTERSPVGYFEYSLGWKESGERFQDLFYHLDALGYVLYRVTPLGLEHLRYFHQTMEDYRYQNIFFAPSGYLDMLTASQSVPTSTSHTAFYRFP
jgi:FkbM family methyltransferase